MFGISGAEFLVILVIAAALIPARSWPAALRAIAAAVRHVRHASGKIQDGIDQLQNEIEKEAPIDALSADTIENFRRPAGRHPQASAKRGRAKKR